MTTPRPTDATSDPTGLHRVLDAAVRLPQAADRLDTRRELWPDEVRIRVERLNLDAASYRQLATKHRSTDGSADGSVDGAAVRAGLPSRRAFIIGSMTLARTAASLSPQVSIFARSIPS